jgi:hypothetical protein
MQHYVPVVGKTGKPLMPTTNQNANKLLARGKALRRFDRGLFYLQLTDRADGHVQPIAVGIDPGSKKESYGLKSHAHTYLHIQADAVTWVKDAEKTSTQMRRTRRYRKTPYRQCRGNRHQGQTRLPPSTRARWGWKLRIAQWLARRFPITTFVVEDIAAETRPGKRRWNQSFSPLEVGKLWFYTELAEIAPLVTREGHYTAALRDQLGLRKTKVKLSDRFEAHAVDSWVLANFYTGGHLTPDNTQILYLVPLRFHRRQLHRLEPAVGGKRAPYGGTISLGFKRGSWVKHPRYGMCYVGGSSAGGISLHAMQTGKRLTQTAKPADLQVLCTASWRMRRAV